MSSQLRIVLVGTTHPGNIGATARAMKNMCLDSLWLVRPRSFPSAEATARASGADEILARAKVCQTLDEALVGCRLVMGASARPRTVRWPQLGPRGCAERLLAEARHAPVALLFGRESSGLSNAELDRCHYLVQIPSNRDFASLNLAAAVQVLTYEIRAAALQSLQHEPRMPPEVAGAEVMEGFFQHLEQALLDLGFAHPKQSEQLLRRLRRLFLRARPDNEEINILRGMLSAAQGRKSMRR
jgi:tRNA (cytidine32/uridine32-2'-O)-methyltransferase